MRKLLIASALLLAATGSCTDDSRPEARSSPTTTTTPVPDTSVPLSGAALVSVGSSFGMCAGYCITEVEVTRDRLTMTRSTHSGGDALVTTGRLTDAGRRRLADVEAALAEVDLEERYGCPDCADGGASWVDVTTASGTKRSVYDYLGPPEVLVDADGLAQLLIETLSTCTASEVARPSDDCEPAAP